MREIGLFMFQLTFLLSNGNDIICPINVCIQEIVPNMIFQKR